MSKNELCFKPATELSQLLKSKALSATELMEAHIAQIESVNPKLNAIVTFLPEQALEAAKQADETISKSNSDSNSLGVLHGLPVAHKDLASTKGIRTTFGSPIYKDFVPDKNDLLVDKLQTAGALTLGKTNTPEFGAGSQTFNEVFGATCNPYDQTKTCGGSSGGAAVALASGMVPIADGSDMGGSLRNPASFCNIAGFRPSPGRVPSEANGLAWSPTAVYGPMARTVSDIALMMQAMSGYDSRDPLSIKESGDIFAKPLERDFKGVKVAWSKNLNDFPVDPQVTEVLEKQRKVFEDLGCIVEEVSPDFSGADNSFTTFRAQHFANGHRDHLVKHRDLLKESVIWNTEEGFKLTSADINLAERQRSELFMRLNRFMQDYEYILMPVAQVPPFDVTTEYITEINGETLPNYIAWMKSCYYISATGHPALSVPAGFTKDGLPIGLQIVGRHQADVAVLEMGHAYEGATEFWKQQPAI